MRHAAIPATREVTPDSRHQQLIDDMQWPARHLQIFGIHVHVGVHRPTKAIAMVNALSAYIPHFLGFSASSPYWMGHDTGMSSWRWTVFDPRGVAGGFVLGLVCGAIAWGITGIAAGPSHRIDGALGRVVSDGCEGQAGEG